MRIWNTLIAFLQRDIWDDTLVRGGSWVKRAALMFLRKRVLEARLFFSNRALQSASALSFSTVVSLIPLLAVLFMIFKMVDGRDFIESIKPSLYTFLSPGAGDQFTDTLDSLLQSATVDTLGIVGFVFLLGSVFSLLSSIEETLNKIWGVPQHRKFMASLKAYGLLLILFPLFIASSFFVSSQVSKLGEDVIGGFSNFFGTIAFPFLMVMFIFFIFMYSMPNCSINVRRAWVGAFVGAALFSLSQEAFLHYTRMAVNANIIYGSLVALPFFFLWLYISWIIVLYAAHVVYVGHNIDHLIALERSRDIGRADEVRLGVMVSIVLTQDTLTLRKDSAGLCPSEIALRIGAPTRDIRDILMRFEKMNFIARIVGKEDRFMLRLSPTQCTLGMVMDALDRAWLVANTYKGETNFPVFERLFVKNTPRLKSYRDITILSMVEMNNAILAQYPEGAQEGKEGLKA
jgi:membrane protein